MALVPLGSALATIRSVIDSSVDQQNDIELEAGDTVDVDVSSQLQTGNFIAADISGVHSMRLSQINNDRDTKMRFQVPSGQNLEFSFDMNFNAGTFYLNPQSGTQYSTTGTPTDTVTFTDPGFVNVDFQGDDGDSCTFDSFTVTYKGHPTGATATTNSISKV